MRYSVGAIEEGRRLANKLWNVARLILQQTEGVEPAARPSALEERWILARLDEARAAIEDAWSRFDFAAATNVLYHLTFDDFCDWYAEAAKARLYDGDEDARATALAALERLLALLHPLMPHVTEEIWSHLPDRRARLVVSAWPEPDASNADWLGALDRVQEAARVFRRSGVRVELAGDEEQRVFAAVVRPERHRAAGDADAERERLRKEIARAEGMLANERFVANAPRTSSTRSAPSSSAIVASSRSSGSSARWRSETTSPGSRGSRPGRPAASGSSACTELLAALDHPEAGLPAVHVVGTNGKSTTTRMVEALLLADGRRAGAYLSPHVRSWAERIRDRRGGGRPRRRRSQRFGRRPNGSTRPSSRC